MSCARLLHICNHAEGMHQANLLCIVVLCNIMVDLHTHSQQYAVAVLSTN